MEWKRHHTTTSRPGDRDGRILGRLGSCVQWNPDRGTVVSTGTTTAHQCAGVDSRHVCCSGIGEGETECPHPSENGQHIGSIIHEHDGGYSVSQANRSDMPSMELVSSTGHNTLSFTPSRTEQPVCHTVEQPTDQVYQLEAGSRSDGDGCLSSQLDGSGRLCFPSIFADRQVSTKD